MDSGLEKNEQVLDIFLIMQDFLQAIGRISGLVYVDLECDGFVPAVL